MKARTPIFQSLAGLLLGLCGGVLARHGTPAPWIVPLAQTVGGIWLDALRMSVMPMVFVMIVAGVGNTLTAASASGAAGRTLALFAGLRLGAALFGVLLMQVILILVPVPHPAQAGAAATAAIALPAPADWLRGFIPANPFAAAASGAVAPLVVFGLLFGLAVTRIEPELRASLLRVFEAIMQTLLVIVSWVCRLAPFGVAALALASTAQVGLTTAGTLIHYVVVASLFGGVLIVLLCLSRRLAASLA